MSQDAKKDEFRKYLEKAGVLELLTKSLVQLYEEPDKPSDALTYLKKSVGGSQDDKAIIAQLKQENEELTAKVAELEASQVSLKATLAALEKSSGEATVTTTRLHGLELSQLYHRGDEGSCQGSSTSNLHLLRRLSPHLRPHYCGVSHNSKRT